MSELIRRDWYTVDTVFENGMALCSSYYSKEEAVKAYNNEKKNKKKSDGGHIRLSYHVEHVDYLKDEVIVGKEQSK